MSERYCKNCLWFDSEHFSLKTVNLLDTKTEVGYCRKHKPVIFTSGGWYWGSWPLVDVLDLCGEFRIQVIGD